MSGTISFNMALLSTIAGCTVGANILPLRARLVNAAGSDPEHQMRCNGDSRRLDAAHLKRDSSSVASSHASEIAIIRGAQRMNQLALVNGQQATLPTIIGQAPARLPIGG